MFYCEPEQKDIFGRLAKIFGFPGLKEADNLEIRSLIPQNVQEGQSSKVVRVKKARIIQNLRPDQQKCYGTWVTGCFVAF